MREKKVYTVREVTALTGFFNTPAPPLNRLCAQRRCVLSSPLKPIKEVSQGRITCSV
jgi:hypothetical protein